MVLKKALNQKEFIQKASQIIISRANKEIAKNKKFTLVLSGGNTPKDIFANLASNHKSDVDWKCVHIFWLDERCVSPSHKDSNYKLAHEYLLSKIPVGSIHRIKGEIDPQKAAQEYAQDIIDFFNNDEISFDFLLIGMGTDGHIASLFANSKEIEDKHSLVLATSKQYNNYFRVTLGIKAINNSKFNLLIFKGQKKYKTFLQKSNLPKDRVIFHQILYTLK